VFDIGRVINAKTAASQLRGGIVLGRGLAMAEQTLVDPRWTDHEPEPGGIPPSRARRHSTSRRVVPGRPDPNAPLGILGAGEVDITAGSGEVGR
jgi:xanthine dehydrogenase YagR molybdenum-binding subunit